MKKVYVLIFGVGFMLFLAASCSKKPDCQTRAGKQKKKYYNSVQYQ